MEIAPVLLISGIILVVAGFGLIAFITLLRIADPGMTFALGGFGLIGAGIVCVIASWFKLS